MERIQLRLELLRLTCAMTRDAIEARDKAQVLETWVLEEPEKGETPVPEKSGKGPRRKPVDNADVLS